MFFVNINLPHQQQLTEFLRYSLDPTPWDLLCTVIFLTIVQYAMQKPILQTKTSQDTDRLSMQLNIKILTQINQFKED